MYGFNKSERCSETVINQAYIHGAVVTTSRWMVFLVFSKLLQPCAQKVLSLTYTQKACSHYCQARPSQWQLREAPIHQLPIL